MKITVSKICKQLNPCSVCPVNSQFLYTVHWQTSKRDACLLWQACPASIFKLWLSVLTTLPSLLAPEYFCALTGVEDWIVILWATLVDCFSYIFYSKLSMLNIIFSRPGLAHSLPVKQKSLAFELKIQRCPSSEIVLCLDVAAEAFSWVLHLSEVCLGHLRVLSSLSLHGAIQRHLGHKWPREYYWLKGCASVYKGSTYTREFCGQNIQNKIRVWLDPL